ncbi:replication terminator protein [Macrococcoides canis]|uniref:replication terminator protein n=1 Tax=Macrococcoides canis TaxID=1855823 RepID=UPI001F3A8638|nr:replication terminator protein [Macrococcus canis]UJS28471.1 replication terminator protein [Macrococcus canis]
MKNIDLNLNTILDGAVQEQFDLAMEEVLKNIHDPNTEPGIARKVNVTFKISSNPARETLNVEVDTKTSLVGKQPVMATLLTGEDASGVHARELKSGAKDQTYFDDNGTVRNDDGKPVEKESNVTPIKNKKALFK